MSGNTSQFSEYILDLLSPLNAISSGKFFGGQGIACDSVQFSMMMGNSVFFVVDDSSREKYINMGTECFWYTKKTGKVYVRKYHEVPAELFDDPDTFLSWAEEAIGVAKRLKSKR